MFEAIRYALKLSSLEHAGKPALRISYTRLQRRLPFYSRRWVIEILGRLAAADAITIHKTGRVNILTTNLPLMLEQYSDTSGMLVFCDLARKVGVNEAIVLQQV